MICQDDTVWRLLARNVWAPELLHVEPQSVDTAKDENSSTPLVGGEELTERNDATGTPPQPYESFRELVLDRNARFAGASVFPFHHRRAIESSATPRPIPFLSVPIPLLAPSPPL
jgi:hypothetical protein